MKTLSLVEPLKHAVAVVILSALMLVFLNQFFISTKTIRNAMQGLPVTQGHAEFQRGFDECLKQF